MLCLNQHEQHVFFELPYSVFFSFPDVVGTLSPAVGSSLKLATLTFTSVKHPAPTHGLSLTLYNSI